MAGHEEELQALIETHGEEEINFEDEDPTDSPRSADSDGFTEVKDDLDKDTKGKTVSMKKAPSLTASRTATASSGAKIAGSPGSIHPKVAGTTFKPKTPIMGGLLEVALDTYAPWTGGKPKPNWSGLENPKPGVVEPKQHRPTSISSATKSQYYRTLGMESKFSKDKDLLTFQRKVENTLLTMDWTQ